ncbi:MAG: diaminopimelate decarboxylase [Bacteroidales bacterium]|nr:diaminopimelate decarboxylase [Bacteroidales bacterium]MBN2756880.1 diaminopimelate decarboxylase [Bacteroidales bacterium]
MFNSDILQQFSDIQTPFYFYDMDLLSKSLYNLKLVSEKYGYIVHYALKANSNDRTLETVKNQGFGADCVSGNEVKKAVEIGFDAEKIVFAGVGKSDSEINFAIDNSIFGFNCESIEEIEIINELASKKNKKVSVSLRLNPDIDALTHNYLTTGLSENKFGIPLVFLDNVIFKMKNLTNVELIGLHFHIGSQIRSLKPYIKLCDKINQIQEELFENHNIKLKHINLGGGLGINYENPDNELVPDYESFFDTINKYLNVNNNQQIHFELGRSVVGQMGSLISKVLYIKNGVEKKFVILDAGMTDLIRPALYGSVHKIENISKKNIPSKICKYDVVGPVCESSDVFASQMELAETQRGDLLAIRSAGAYGEIMVSEYNLRNKPLAVYSDEMILKNKMKIAF